MTEIVEVVAEKQLPSAIPPITAFMNESKAMPASVEIESQRVIAEVKASVAAAKYFPRDEMLARKRVLEACRNPKLAERALWKMPRGAGEISGPSIRLAETIARCWGNLDFGLIEHGQYGNRSQVETFCWDKETNNRKRILFDVPHIRFSNSAGENQAVLKDPAKIYEVVSAAGQRRVRDCIIASVPNDLVEDAIAVVLATRAAASTDVGKLAVLLLEVFAREFAIPPAQIEAHFGKSQTQLAEAELQELRDIYTALKDGMAKPSDYFQAATAQSAAAALIEKPAVKPAAKPEAKPAAVKPVPTPGVNTAATSVQKATAQANTKDAVPTADPVSPDPKPSASAKSSTEPSTGSQNEGGTEDPKPAASAEEASSSTGSKTSSSVNALPADAADTADTTPAPAASLGKPSAKRAGKKLW